MEVACFARVDRGECPEAASRKHIPFSAPATAMDPAAAAHVLIGADAAAARAIAPVAVSTPSMPQQISGAAGTLSDLGLQPTQRVTYREGESELPCR